MTKYRHPEFVIEYTPKTVSAILSPAAMNGDPVEIDVHARLNITQKHLANGQRVTGSMEIFRVVVSTEGVSDSYDWNYNILRESADRSKKHKK